MGHQYPFPTKFLWSLNANFANGSDQPFTCLFTGTPPVDSRSGLYIPTGVYVPIWPGSSGTGSNPTGGIFDGASGGGNAIVASTQVWQFTSNNTFVIKLNSAVCPDPYVGGTGALLTAANPPRLFLNTPGTGSAYIFIVGYEVSATF